MAKRGETSMARTPDLAFRQIIRWTSLVEQILNFKVFVVGGFEDSNTDTLVSTSSARARRLLISFERVYSSSFLFHTHHNYRPSSVALSFPTTPASMAALMDKPSAKYSISLIHVTLTDFQYGPRMKPTVTRLPKLRMSSTQCCPSSTLRVGSFGLWFCLADNMSWIRQMVFGSQTVTSTFLNLAGGYAVRNLCTSRSEKPTASGLGSLKASFRMEGLFGMVQVPKLRDVWCPTLLLTRKSRMLSFQKTS